MHVRCKKIYIYISTCSRKQRTIPQIRNYSKMDVIQRKPQNYAIHTSPAHDLRLAECEIPKLQPDECLVHIRATGICGSDVHFWKHGHIGPMIVTGDNGLGHESAGLVIQVGEAVTRFKPGKYISSHSDNSDITKGL